MGCPIYIVKGHTGEWSDRCEWLVAAFFSEEAAKQRVLDATKWFRENVNMNGDYHRITEKNPHDPNMQIDYTGTGWSIEETIIEGAFP